MKGFWDNLENKLLILFLVLIPTQLGKHFWPEWSLVMGVRVDYLSPILYVTDLVWIAWVCVKLVSGYFGIGKPRFGSVVNFQNILMSVFVLVNVLVAENKWVAIYKWCRLAQWMLTMTWLSFDRKRIIKLLEKVIPVWVVGEVLLGLAQVVKGGSLNGWWYWLGERRFDYGSLGVAQISVAGEGLIRAYGTFSHPNSLAGFLLVSLVLWNRYKRRNIGWWVVTWLCVVGLVITGSRTIWVLGLVAVLALSMEINKMNIKKIVGVGSIVIGVFIFVIGLMGINYRMSDYLGGWDSDSLAKRVNLNMVGMRMWRDNFFVGVGSGNFIVKLPEYQSGSKFYWLQPIHNIFLLAGVELGVLGMILVIFLAISMKSRVFSKKNWLLVMIVVVTGLIDHYWVTLPQNSWLLAVVLGII